MTVRSKVCASRQAGVLGTVPPGSCAWSNDADPLFVEFYEMVRLTPPEPADSRRSAQQRLAGGILGRYGSTTRSLHPCGFLRFMVRMIFGRVSLRYSSARSISLVLRKERTPRAPRGHSPEQAAWHWNRRPGCGTRPDQSIYAPRRRHRDHHHWDFMVFECTDGARPRPAISSKTAWSRSCSCLRMQLR